MKQGLYKHRAATIWAAIDEDCLSVEAICLQTGMDREVVCKVLRLMEKGSFAHIANKVEPWS